MTNSLKPSSALSQASFLSPIERAVPVLGIRQNSHKLFSRFEYETSPQVFWLVLGKVFLSPSLIPQWISNILAVLWCAYGTRQGLSGKRRSLEMSPWQTDLNPHPIHGLPWHKELSLAYFPATLMFYPLHRTKQPSIEAVPQNNHFLP